MPTIKKTGQVTDIIDTAANTSYILLQPKGHLDPYGQYFLNVSLLGISSNSLAVTGNLAASATSLNLNIVMGDGNDVVTVNNFKGGTATGLGISTGKGNDIIVVSNATGNVGISSANGNDTISVSNVTGVVSIDSGAGNDVITVNSIISATPVSILAGEGNDIIYGGNTNAIIQAGAGNDTVVSGSGNKQITGGLGNDLLYAGTGQDKFFYTKTDGLDTIFNYNAAKDSIQISGYSLATTIFVYNKLTKSTLIKLNANGTEGILIVGANITGSNYSTTYHISFGAAPNNPAVIGDPLIHDVTENATNSPAVLTATGILSISDLDAGEAAFQTTVAPIGAVLGSLNLAANGAYTYSVNNNLVQYLANGETKIESFTVTSVDGTQKTISFTIHGINESAIIGTPTVHDVTEDAAALLTATGPISISDLDHNQNNFQTTLKP